MSVAAGVLVGALAAAVSVAWLARDHRPRGGHRAPASTYLRALPMFIGTVSLAAMLSVDVLALGANHSVVVGGAAVIGTYQVASMVARLPYFLGDALINAVFPYMARRHDSVVDSHAYFTAAARWALLIVLPIEAILLLNPTPILALLFPATYAGADVPIRILAIGASLALATVFFAKGLQAIGRVGAAAAGTAIALVVEALVLVTLVPRLGAVGAAIGFLAGTVTASAILGIVYARHQRQPLIVGRDAVRHIIALAVMAPPLLLARGAPTWIGIGSIAIALLAYVMAVFATRLVSWHEIRRYLDIAGTTVGISGRVPR